MNSALQDAAGDRDSAHFEYVQTPCGPLTAAEKEFLLSVVIPARDEEDCLESTVIGLLKEFAGVGMLLQIVVVDDNSTDRTQELAERLASDHEECSLVVNVGASGFGRAVRQGLTAASGDGVAVVMADGSDDPVDAVSYARLLARGWDCVFGSRFLEKGSVEQYPATRLIVNRLGNMWIERLLSISYNDMTNAFKAYSASVMERITPLESEDFSLTIEMPMKTVDAGCRHAVLPVKWHGRSMGKSKWRFASQCVSYVRMAFSLRRVGCK